MVTKWVCFLSFFQSLCFAIEGDLPEPYRSLGSLMIYTPSGWYQKGNRWNLDDLIIRYNVHTIVEVGSWMGRSAMHLASRLPENGKLYAVDTWEGSPNERPHHDPAVIATLYEQFLSNMIHTQLTEKVVPIRSDSVLAANQLKDTIHPDLVYIDATHTYEAVKADLNAWFPHVKGHGVICGDDLTIGDHGVAKAVLEFMNEHDLILYQNGFFWWLEEQDLHDKLGPLTWVVHEGDNIEAPLSLEEIFQIQSGQELQRDSDKPNIPDVPNAGFEVDSV